MEIAMSQENMPTSSTISEPDICPVCGQEPICGGLGLVRQELPVDHPDFGKMLRCPNNNAEQDIDWQRRLRQLSNLSAFSDKTMDNFQIDLSMFTPAQQESLRHALNVAKQFAEKPFGWILFQGTYGCGKTHLAAAIGNVCLERGDNVLFITAPDLLDHLRSAYGPSSELGYDQTFDRIRNSPVLVLDDLGVENPSAWAQEKLFQLLNHRYSHQMPTVITTNAALDGLDQRVRSRLLDNQVNRHVKISAPDFRSLVPHQQLESNLSYYLDMTFDSFDVHNNANPEEKNNLEKGLRIARSYAEDPAGWLLLLGPYGTGKTHLAAAIAQHRQYDMGEEVRFLTVPDLLDYLRVTYDPDIKSSFDKRFQAIRNVSFLVLDDLGTENATAWAKEKLFQLLDHRYVARLPTVITTAKKLEKIDERIASRVLDERRCTTFSLNARSYALRRKRSR